MKNLKQWKWQSTCMSSLCFIYIYIQPSSSIFLNLSTRKVRNFCVTNDHGYIPFVVITIRSIPHSWLITGFARRATRQVQHVEQKLPNLLESLTLPPFFTCLNVVHAIKLHVFMFLVPCYDLLYDFHVKTMFYLSWLLFVVYGIHVLFILFVFIYTYWCLQHNLFTHTGVFNTIYLHILVFSTQFIYTYWCLQHNFHIRLYTCHLTVTPSMSHVEQELFLMAVRVARFLVFLVMFCRSLFVLFLLAIVFPVILRFTTSD